MRKDTYFDKLRGSGWQSPNEMETTSCPLWGGVRPLILATTSYSLTLD
jgi:hypothetical protein